MNTALNPQSLLSKSITVVTLAAGALLTALCAAFCMAVFTTVFSPAVAAITVPSNGAASTGFTLPTQLKAQYSGTGKFGKLPLSGTGQITWKTTAKDNGLVYVAGLDIGAFFYKTTLQSQGTVNASGILPVRIEEKSTGKTATIIAIDHKGKRVKISGKDAPTPYEPQAQDLITVIAQLSTLLQTQPQWRTAGEQKTFWVYRPSGIKPWRFQSQGVQTITVDGQSVSTVVVVQVSYDAASEQDEKHQFWLDPARHGFPIKLRKIKSGGDFVELTLTSWQEQP